MSRSSAATAAGRSRTVRRSPAPPLPRRVSGPAAPNRRDDGSAPPPRAPRARIDASALAFADTAVAPYPLTAPRPRPRTRPAPRPQRLAYGGVAIATRMAGVAVDVSASRAMDRLVRSRVWIGVIAFSLLGLVAMQVSLLKLNAGIGRAVQTASTLERSNALLRGEVSRLSAGERISSLAGGKGLVMPAPADVTYLRASDSHGDAARAARRMRAPDPLNAGLAGAVVESGLMSTTAGTAAPTGVAVVPGAEATATAPVTTPQTTAPAATDPATATVTTPAAATPATTAQATAPAATTASSGGAIPQTTPVP